MAAPSPPVRRSIDGRLGTLIAEKHRQLHEDPLTALLDAAMTESAPVARQLLAILGQRGWRGWNRLDSLNGRPPPGCRSLAAAVVASVQPVTGWGVHMQPDCR